MAEWTAISGAAIGSGMGTYTRSALSALLFVSGLRLGYWQKNLCQAHCGVVIFEKYRAMFRECLGMFPGLRSAKWYLSDGGHFDNTGVYALLKRKLDLIVLADCGADPDYVFGDVENLIRKARIDYDQDIEFVDPLWLEKIGHPLARYVATPTTISSLPGDQFLLLARVRYSAEKSGALLIIKPRMPTEFDLDTTAYAERHPPFPQQSTAQQFFSEEQWESYCHLGKSLTSLLTAQVIAQLPAMARAADVTTLPAGKLATNVTQRSRRSTAATVGASLGAGAVFTAVIATWQAWHAQQVDTARLEKEAYSRSTEVTETIRLARDLLLVSQLNDTVVKDTISDLIELSSKSPLLPINRAEMNALISTLSRRCEDPDERNKDGCGNLVGKMATALEEKRSAWTIILDEYKDWNEPKFPAPYPKWPTIWDLLSPTKVVQLQDHKNATSAALSAPSDASRTSRASVALAAVTGDVRTACVDGEKTMTVYIQVYAETERAKANELALSLKAFGLQVPSVENVSETAVRSGKRTPVK